MDFSELCDRLFFQWKSWIPKDLKLNFEPSFKSKFYPCITYTYNIHYNIHYICVNCFIWGCFVRPFIPKPFKNLFYDVIKSSEYKIHSFRLLPFIWFCEAEVDCGKAFELSNSVESRVLHKLAPLSVTHTNTHSWHKYKFK